SARFCFSLSTAASARFCFSLSTAASALQHRRGSSSVDCSIGEVNPSARFRFSRLQHRRGSASLDCIIHANSHDVPQGKNELWATDGSPLIPLAEFREREVMKKYEFKPDVDVLDLLDTTSRQKEIKVVTKLYWGGDARDRIIDDRIGFVQTLVLLQLKKISWISTKLMKVSVSCCTYFYNYTDM
ncbi:hypothetical protein LINPERPRIM_LOCUS41048, partial [Linum perenne]